MSKAKHAIAALGTLSFKWSRRKNRTEEFYMSQLKNGQMQIQDITDLADASYMSLSLNIQILRCRYVDFVANRFKQIAKRCLFYPVTFNYTDKKQLHVAEINGFSLKSSSKKSINIDRAVAKMSGKDIELLVNIID